jgi:hypothetical protein
MPFDPTKPATNSPLSSAEMRDQLNALKALIDAQAAGVQFGRAAADWTSSVATFSDVPGLAFAVAAGESWQAEIVLHAISGTTGQGLKFRVTGPGAASVMIAIVGTGSGSSTTTECEVQTAFSVASPAKSFVTGPTLTGVVRLHVAITAATAPGTIQLQASNSSGSGTVTLKAGSDLVARRSGV